MADINDIIAGEVSYDQGYRAGKDTILSEIDNLLTNIKHMEFTDIVGELKAIKKTYGGKY